MWFLNNEEIGSGINNFHDMTSRSAKNLQYKIHYEYFGSLAFELSFKFNLK